MDSKYLTRDNREKTLKHIKWGLENPGVRLSTVTQDIPEDITVSEFFTLAEATKCQEANLWSGNEERYIEVMASYLRAVEEACSWNRMHEMMAFLPKNITFEQLTHVVQKARERL